MALDPAFVADVDEIVAIVAPQNCNRIKRIRLAQNYDELYNLLQLNSAMFKCNPNLLKDILATIDDAILLDHDIHLLKAGDISNPKFVVGGALGVITLDTSSDKVYIHSGATATKILVKDNATIDYLLVAGGSVIDEIEVQAGSKVEYILINSCGGTTPSSIDNVTAPATTCDLPENIEIIKIEP